VSKVPGGRYPLRAASGSVCMIQCQNGGWWSVMLTRQTSRSPRDGPSLPYPGVKVSSSARSWTLRSSSSGDAEAAPQGCRPIRTTWRLPPHGQPVAEDPLREAKPRL
jgi:hypothetical protein